jgi:hypothetical protein
MFGFVLQKWVLMGDLGVQTVHVCEIRSRVVKFSFTVNISVHGCEKSTRERAHGTRERILVPVNAFLVPVNGILVPVNGILVPVNGILVPVNGKIHDTIFDVCNSQGQAKTFWDVCNSQ